MSYLIWRPCPDVQSGVVYCVSRLLGHFIISMSGLHRRPEPGCTDGGAAAVCLFLKAETADVLVNVLCAFYAYTLITFLKLSPFSCMIFTIIVLTHCDVYNETGQHFRTVIMAVRFRRGVQCCIRAFVEKQWFLLRLCRFTALF